MRAYLRMLPKFLSVLAVGAALPLAQGQTTVAEALASYDQLVGNYNVVTFSNLTLNGTHTDSGIAVGGNLTLGSGTVVALQSVAASGSNPALYVNGQVVLNGSSQINNGSVSTPNLSSAATWTYDPAANQYQRQIQTSGGTLSYNTSDAGAYADPRTVAGPAGWDWNAAQATSLSAALVLANATATGSIGVSGQTLTLTSNLSGITVFELDASRIVNGIYDLNGDGIFDQNTERISNIRADLAADQYFVVNVTNATSADGSTVLFDGVSNFNAGTNNDQLLWNIIPDSNSSTADILTLGTDFHGSILAPLVDVQNNGHYLNGQIVAGSLTQTNAEIHYAGGYDGPVAFAPVPEPGTYALFACALCGAGIWLRRRLLARRDASETPAAEPNPALR